MTPNHPLYSVNRNAFVEAGGLTRGERLLRRRIRDNLPVRIVRIETDAETVPVFDITVHPYANYFAEGILAHNY